MLWRTLQEYCMCVCKQKNVGGKLTLQGVWLFSGLGGSRAHLCSLQAQHKQGVISLKEVCVCV